MAETSSGTPARISRSLGSMLLVLSNPLGEELHVEGAICWDLCHWDPEGRLEADPDAGIVIEPGDLDRFLVVGIVALLPHLASSEALLTEQVLVIARGTHWTWCWVLTAFAPTGRPVAAVATRLAAQRPHVGLFPTGPSCVGLLGPLQLQAFPPGKIPDLNLGVSLEKVLSGSLPRWPVHWLQGRHGTGGNEKFHCHWDLSQNGTFWSSLQWIQDNLFTSHVDPTQPTYSHV